MPTSTYPHGFTNGVAIHEFPYVDTQNANGNVFWVDSVKGSNGNKGTFTKPFATIDYAIGRCTADQGDKIYVAAGHEETIIAAAGITADVNGISIIGLGNENNRPVITFGTDTAATISVTSNNVNFENILFVCDIASQVTMIDCDASFLTINNCTFREGSATGLVFVTITGTSTNNCDGVKIVNSVFEAPTAGNYTEAITLGEVNAKIKIMGCTFYGNFSQAAIHNPTGKVLTELTISGCTISNLTTTKFAIELVSACTGICSNNFMYADGFATTIDPGALKCFECYSVSAVDKNGRLNPVIET